jgi:hypothetical protein
MAAPNALQMPDAPGYEDNPLMRGPTLADAWDVNRNSYADWLARDRAKQIELGYLDPATGSMTPAGMKHQAEVISGGLGPADIGALGIGAIKAYHGSPHAFERFDMSKIGSGEGSQAYGHGLYFAENEGVAQSYKGAGPTANAQLDAINARLSDLSRQMDKLSPGGYRKFTDPVEGARLSAEYDALMSSRHDLGHMYEANLAVEPEHMLDWDKRLHEQPAGAAARTAYEEAIKRDLIARGAPPSSAAKDVAPGGRFALPPDPHARGSDVILSGERYLSGGSEHLATSLRDLGGIPGVSYLDAGSRGPGGGTRNHVLFDDQLIDIARKYGLPALITGGAAANALGPQEQ